MATAATKTITEAIASPEDVASLWTAEDVAKLLRCSPKTVGRLVKTESLPSIKLGKGGRRFNPEKVLAWVASREATINPVKPTSGPEKTARPKFITPTLSDQPKFGRRGRIARDPSDS